MSTPSAVTPPPRGTPGRRSSSHSSLLLLHGGVHPPLLNAAPCQSPSSLEDEVERRLGHPAKATETAGRDHLAETCLSRLGAQAGVDFLRAGDGQADSHRFGVGDRSEDKDLELQSSLYHVFYLL